MAVWKRRKISITLRSDLCTGSGYSYAGVIDNDICYDDAGLPYIPARRLKGCMREAADTILYAKYGAHAGKLFGTTGSSAYTGTHMEKESVKIGNAYPEHYSALRNVIWEGRKRSSCYDVQYILGRFTRVIGQTALKDGVADDLTLRYTRVVNHYAPWNERQPMVFIAELGYDPADEAMLEDVLKATRHIGLKRNRGMGNVRIEWCDDQAEETLAEQGRQKEPGTDIPGIICQEDIAQTRLPDGMVMLSIGIENVEPLVLSAEKEDESASCISGQSVLGALAGRYLANGDAESEEFRDLFLGGRARFTNFYPYMHGKIHYPAPAYIRRLKKSKKYVYTLENELPAAYRDNDLDPSGGNQPKALKGKYVSLAGNKISVYDVERDIVYHHRHHDEAGDENAEQLYGLEVVRPGQCFAGSVIVPENYAQTMKQLLLRSPYISFGKSKTAQYGTCRLVQIHPELEITEKRMIPKGSTVVVTFLSDAIFCVNKGNETGGQYTVFYDQVRDAVRSELGIQEDTSLENKYLSVLQTSVRMGYLGVWNLRKPAVPVVSAGSCLSYVLAEDFCTDKVFTGERNLEGFGQISVHRAEDLMYDGIEEMTSGQPAAGRPEIERTCDQTCAVPGYTRNMMQPILIGNWMDREKLGSIRGTGKRKIKANITNTALGRIILMLRECIDKYPDAAKAEDRYYEFVRRIQSIKGDSARKEGRGIAKLVGEPGKDVSGDKVDRSAIHLHELIGFSGTEPEYTELLHLGFTEAEIDAAVKAGWSDYLMALLVDRKYKGDNNGQPVAAGTEVPMKPKQ